MDDRHKDWIEVSGVHWAIHQPRSATASQTCAMRKTLSRAVGLKFSRVKWKYTQQKIGGGMCGNTAGGWDLAGNRCA